MRHVTHKDLGKVKSRILGAASVEDPCILFLSVLNTVQNFGLVCVGESLVVLSSQETLGTGIAMRSC